MSQGNFSDSQAMEQQMQTEQQNVSAQTEGQERQSYDEYDDFDAGFYAPESDSAADSAADSASTDVAATDTKSSTRQVEDGEQVAPPAPQMPTFQPQVQQQPVQQQPAPAPAPEPQPATKTVEIPDDIKAEFEALKKLSPDAAALAMEDSKEGARVRRRLAEFGAEVAQDRAEDVLERRKERQEAQARELSRQREAVEAQNRSFMSVLEHDHPEHVQLLRDASSGDAAKQATANAYLQDIYAWIESKPYREGARLMAVAQGGRDPHEVSALLSQYKAERQAKAGGTGSASAAAAYPSTAAAHKSPAADPTGALAVPGRGAPTAPAGLGSKDDFDAGWRLNESER